MQASKQRPFLEVISSFGLQVSQKRNARKAVGTIRSFIPRIAIVSISSWFA